MTYFPNDADIEMAQLEQLGDRAAAARKRGQCYHGGRQAHGNVWNGREFDDTVLATCADCGKHATWGELDEDMHNIIGG
jgi:hypothetical protein